jgi:polysaccharide biosynthesis transport protein
MSDLVRRDAPSAPAVYEPRPENIWIDQYLDEHQSELTRYAAILWKRKWLFLSVAVAVLLASGIWTLTTKQLYTSSVKLQLDPQQNVLPYREVANVITADPTYLATQAQVLKSQALAERIVTRMNLAAEPNGVTAAARGFAGRVVVTPVPSTQVMNVSYTSEDPVFAAKAVNILADEYVNYSVDIRQVAAGKAKEFLEQELTKLRYKLEQSEEQLVEYGREHGILLPSEDNNMAVQRLTDLSQEMTKVEIEVLRNEYDELRSTTVDNFPESRKTTVMKDLENRRSGLEQKLATVSQRFGPKWPEVQTLTQELGDVRKQLVNERQRIIEQARVEYALATARRDKLGAALTEQNRIADRLSQDSIQYNILKREVETGRQLHEGLLQRMKETDVSAGLKAANVHVIDRGQVPTRPSSPNILRNMALGLMLGLVLGTACTIGVEMLDRTVRTPEDVERQLRLPFLGAIPAFSESWREANGGILVPLKGQSPENGLYYVSAASEVYWDSYRALRTSLLFSSPEGRPRSLLITSALPGEGKSTTCVNLAISLAQTAARTVILELDMRRPRLANLFNISNKQGMSRYLSGQSELHTEVQQTGIPNLFVVPSGPIPPNPPELLGSARMSRALELLGRHFEYVVIDGPPLVPVTDALVVSTQVNGVVLVVQGGKTPNDVVQKARNLLKSVDAKVLGVLVNNVKVDSPDMYYYSYRSGVRDSSYRAGTPKALEGRQS